MHTQVHLCTYKVTMLGTGESRPSAQNEAVHIAVRTQQAQHAAHAHWMGRM